MIRAMRPSRCQTHSRWNDFSAITSLHVEDQMDYPVKAQRDDTLLQMLGGNGMAVADSRLAGREADMASCSHLPVRPREFQCNG